MTLLPLEKASFFHVCSLALKQSGVSREAQCPLMYQPGALLNVTALAGDVTSGASSSCKSLAWFLVT